MVHTNQTVTNGSHKSNGYKWFTQIKQLQTVQNVKQCVHMLDEHMRQNVVYGNQCASMLREHT